jgi:hypothetical protein
MVYQLPIHINNKGSDNMVNKEKISKYLSVKKIFIVLIVITGAVFITACSKDENKTTLKTVLEQVYNCPDEELIELSKEEPKVDESKISDSGTGIAPIEEWVLFDKIEELYQPYFTEEAYQNLLNDRVTFMYHLEAEENNYTLKVNSIDIVKNKTDKTKYDFTTNIIYTPETGDEKTVEIQGTAQFSESGKINYFKIFSDLEKKLNK